MQRYNEFAAELKNARIAANYSQSEVAEQLLLARSTYGHFEEGIRIPPIELILRASALYNRNPLEFLSFFAPQDLYSNYPVYMHNFHIIQSIPFTQILAPIHPDNPSKSHGRRRRNMRRKSRNTTN